MTQIRTVDSHAVPDCLAFFKTYWQVAVDSQLVLHEASGSGLSVHVVIDDVSLLMLLQPDNSLTACLDPRSSEVFRS